MPRYKRIRVRGKPRTDIDVDLLAQALMLASQDRREAERPGGSNTPGRAVETEGAEVSIGDRDGSGRAADSPADDAGHPVSGQPAEAPVSAAEVGGTGDLHERKAARPTATTTGDTANPTQPVNPETPSA